jgi:hypothetical protein
MAAQMTSAFQAQMDSTLGNRGASLDRAYVRLQVDSHKLMGAYLDQLAGVASRPEIVALLGTIGTRAAAQAGRAQALQASFAVADSIVADSLARRAARRSRQAGNR